MWDRATSQRVSGEGVSRQRPARIWTAVAAAAVVVLAGCGGGGADAETDGSSSSASADLRHVSVGANPIVDLAPLWVGKDEGIFEKHGIDLSIETGGGGAALIPGVVSGQFAFTFVNPTTLFVARDKGLDLQVVSNLASSTGKEGSDGSAVLVRDGSPIQSAKDLAGKTVAVNTLNSIGTVVIRQAVRQDGGDPDAVKFIETGFPDMMAALSADRIDAAWEVEPFISTSLKEGFRAVSWPYVATSPELPIALTVTSADLKKNDPQLVDDFRAALEESINFANQHKDVAAQTVTTYTSIKPEQAKEIFFPRWTADINRDGMEKLAQLVQEDKLVSSPVDLKAVMP